MSSSFYSNFCSYSCSVYYWKSGYIFITIVLLGFEIYAMLNETLAQDVFSHPGVSILYNLMILVMIYFAASGYYYKNSVLSRRKYIMSKNAKQSSTEVKSNSTLSNNAKIIDYSEKPKEMIFIKSLNKEVRICCYQTARLGEDLCYCGRAVPRELKDAILKG